MEDTLGVDKPVRGYVGQDDVLILVLMEDTLGVSIIDRSNLPITVLILVLMEDTLGEQDLRILYFRGFDNNKTYQLSPC